MNGSMSVLLRVLLAILVLVMVALPVYWFYSLYVAFEHSPVGFPWTVAIFPLTCIIIGIVALRALMHNRK